VRSRRLRVGVVGIGAVGQHHVRILASLPEVELTAVVDIRPERAEAAAARTGARAATDVGAIVDEVDAAVVAVPTEAHTAVAQPLLERGVAVLVEKPLAPSSADADALLAAAAASGATVAVGHTERHNPAVCAAMALVKAPRFVEVHRLGAFPRRSLDIDVVLDVMIHDLDILLAMVPGEVTAVEAVGVPVLTPKIDIANARLRFASGCIANVTASRISRDRIRKIRIFQPQMYLSVDYAAQQVETWRLVARDGAAPTIEGGRVEVSREEPLRRELQDFVEAVRTGRPPRVTGADGRRALVLAERIKAAMRTA
jgi:predicted dehydrogenase